MSLFGLVTMKRLLLLTLALGWSAFRLPADVIYNVSVNTSSYVGQSGYLDFQLGRGPDSQAASVTVRNFGSSGILDATNLQVAGSATGTLPGAVTLANATAFNDYFQGFTYGASIGFQLVFSGPAITAPGGAQYGSPFAFGLYNAGALPLGPSDGFGNALLIQVNANGTTTATSYNLNVTAAAPNAVPEPSSCYLLGGALLGVLYAAGRGRR